MTAAEWRLSDVIPVGALGARSLHDFAAIALDELVQRASLQTRVDRKYVVPLPGLSWVLSELRGTAKVLDIGGRRDFGYSSVYFDTADLDSYWRAARGRRRRYKIRTRSYLDSGEGYLEVKTRGGRSSTVKDRLEYEPSNARQLTADGRGYVATVLDESGIPAVDPAGLAPVLTTRYSRATLFLPSSESRATVDTRLAWQLETGELLERPALAIVETKSGRRASEVDRLLWAAGHRPATISKYATGMAALRPELGANKWGRVLGREFGRRGRPAAAA